MQKKWLFFVGLFLMLSIYLLVKDSAAVKTLTTIAQRPALQMDVFYPPTATLPPPTPTSAQPSTPTGTGTTPGSGSPSSPAAPTTNVQCLVNQISEAKIREYMGNLVDNDTIAGKDEKQTRWSTYAGNLTEANYIKNHFQSAGLTAEFQPFSVEGGTSRNIIGRLAGSTQNYYLVTSHMDSRENSGHKVAPGADDNGSGTVMVMELARVFKACNFQPKSSIEFITFSGEEQGLYGSDYYVSKRGNKKIQGVINVDMIGNGKTKTCVEFGYKNYNGGDKLAKRIVDMNTKYNIGLSTRAFASSMGRSDHAPFWDANIPAIFGSECEFSPVYHSTKDTTAYINFAQIRKTAQAVAAAVGTLATE